MDYDKTAFAALQARLSDWWPVLTVRTIPHRPRVLVVVSSVTTELPPGIRPMIPAYEERYLCYLMALVRSEHTRVIYVTSMPLLPRLAQYYLDLVKDVDEGEARQRLTLVSVGNPTGQPLSEKLLERPQTIERLKGLIGDSRYGLLMPFFVTAAEARLALALDIPVYACDPGLRALGSKSGSRAVFEAAGVPHPRGRRGVHTTHEVVDAILEMQQEAPTRRVVIKTDFGFSGQGNGVVTLDGGNDRIGTHLALRQLLPDDPSLSPEEFLKSFDTTGGVVEEWIEAEEIHSPSVQLRLSPLGEIEVLSTHEQILGGPGGQTYLGCRFPAPEPFIEPLSTMGRSIAQVLAQHGVIGRFAVDFVMARRGATWFPYALEINLRNGGTTHPMVTLLALTDGTYDEGTGQFMARTGPKAYTATDHLERPEYVRLTPDDVLDLVEQSGLGWNATTETGIALHMVSGVAVSGALGATAVANTPDEAAALMRRLGAILDSAAGVPTSTS